MMRRCGLPSNSHLTRFRFILRITRSHFRNRPYPANKLHRQGYSRSARGMLMPKSIHHQIYSTRPAEENGTQVFYKT